MERDNLEALLQAVRSGEVDLDEALERLLVFGTASSEVASLDHGREARCGFPEVVFGQGKTPAQVQRIVADFRDRGKAALVTRLDGEAIAALAAAFPEGRSEPECGCFTLGAGETRREGRVAVITAGTADHAVGGECRAALRYLGYDPAWVPDVGVAGLHRLLERLPELRRQEVLVVVAGMEGALPSVVGGLLPMPLIAVPTSVGYGAGRGGFAALAGMLSSCASGITVVNIDNGFGAACAAHRICASIHAARETTPYI